jgi:anti-sigma regulatory factor (Ser/Thr protein kinase)
MGARGAERSRNGRGGGWAVPGRDPARAARGRVAPRAETIRLAATDAAPEQARLWLEGLLEWSDGPLEDAKLLTSELVTNSLRHGGLACTDWVEVSVQRPPPTLRVVVRDPGIGFAPPADPRLPPPSQPDGRGLFIVSRVADRWGVASGERTCVWFEIDGPHRLERYH